MVVLIYSPRLVMKTSGCLLGKLSQFVGLDTSNYKFFMWLGQYSHRRSIDWDGWDEWWIGWCSSLLQTTMIICLIASLYLSSSVLLLLYEWLWRRNDAFLCWSYLCCLQAYDNDALRALKEIISTHA